MSAGGALLFLLALTLCSLLILSPLRAGQRRRRTDADDATGREQLLQQYERVLTALRDLDEDQLTGKLDATDHAREREIWLRRGEQLLAALNALQAEDRP